MSKTIVVTGANRGIGLEFVKQLLNQNHHVIACCRQPENATELLKLKQTHDQLEVMPLDVTKLDSINNLAKSLKDVPIDWLINNAGISGKPGVTLGNIETENFLNVFHTNCVGPIQLADALLDNIKSSHDKLVITITSRMGSIADNDSGRSYAYRCSKAAVNMGMRSFALDVEKLGVKCMLLHPGWVQTDMGGAQAQVTCEQSVKGMLDVINKQGNTAHAEVLWRYDNETIPW